MKNLKKEELLKWLEKALDRHAFLQISHPHLAHIPTNKDKQAYKQIVTLIKKLEVGEEFVETWAKEFASLEFLPLVPLHTGDKFMPAYIIKVKNMLIEAGVKIKE